LLPRANFGRRIERGGSLPHASYGVDLSRMPDTYVPPEPFVAYRAWNWTTEGITSLNHARWTPKVAFEATCRHADDLRSMKASCTTPEAEKFWRKQAHHVPDPECTCGMYAGMNMQHLIDIGYIQHGIHGEVHLWGRLYKHTLGWRAQFAYPKNFIVPANMIPLRMEEAKRRLDILTEFEVEIYLQTEEEACVGQETIPLWIPDYGYSTQGLSWLVERGQKWYEEHPKKIQTLKVGDRVAVMSSLAQGSGIGIVKEIKDGVMYYTMFSPTTVYSKPVNDVHWNEQNWRWETSGLSSMRKLECRNYREGVS
jgi:hypothetical protein